MMGQQRIEGVTQGIKKDLKDKRGEKIPTNVYLCRYSYRLLDTDKQTKMSVLMHRNFYLLSIFVVITYSKSVIYSLSFGSFPIVNNRQQDFPPMITAQNYEVAPGINYEYVYVKGNDSNNSKPTIVFLHGFPSSFHSWRHQLKYFSRQGYDCLAPNMMGYGKTYSPLDKDQYKFKSMVEHLIALLNHLHVNNVIVIGHDWGTQVANRFVLYHPERTLGVVLISVGYSPPAIFDLDSVLEASKNAIGYETFGYWKFFEADDAATIIENNLESFIDLAFASDPTLWKTDFAPVGKVRNWLTNGNRTTRGSYMTENDYMIFRQYLAEGMQPKLNWYKATIANINWNDEKNLDPVIKRPVLFIGGTKDYVTLVGLNRGPNQYIADFETVALETGHWVMEENPDAVNREIDRWIKRIL
jgi:pimeloyl-ACP methyl ester carboxylesterase